MSFLTQKDYFKHQLSIAKAKAAAVRALYAKTEETVCTNIQLQAIEITALSYSLAMINAEVQYLHDQINQLADSINT